MRIARGRWIADSESMVLTYDNGRLGRVYCFPIEEVLSPGEASAWIVEEDTGRVFSGDDIRNLDLALQELLGFRIRTAAPFFEPAVAPAVADHAMLPRG
jgi:hypothetical protein